MQLDDVSVCRDVAAALRNLQSRGIPYADIFSPLPDDRLAEAMKRSAVLLRVDQLGEKDQELVTPPIYGRYIMTISKTLDPRRRGFATRHGFGHVVAGHVSEVAFLSTERDWMTHEERVADLFALADVVPFWLLNDLRKSRTSWGAIKQMISRTIRQYTIGWSEARVFDRATLRITLYRQHGS
jgi:hypothetical protein